MRGGRRVQSKPQAGGWRFAIAIYMAIPPLPPRWYDAQSANASPAHSWAAAGGPWGVSKAAGGAPSGRERVSCCQHDTPGGPLVPRRGQGCRRYIWPSARWPNPAARGIANGACMVAKHVRGVPEKDKTPAGETQVANLRLVRGVLGHPGCARGGPSATATCGG